MLTKTEIQSALLKAAQAAYPDNLVPTTYAAAVSALNQPSKGPGDTLAVFLAVEICEVTDGVEDLTEAACVAAQAIETSMRELSLVADALYDLSRKQPSKE